MNRNKHQILILNDDTLPLLKSILEQRVPETEEEMRLICHMYGQLERETSIGLAVIH